MTLENAQAVTEEQTQENEREYLKQQARVLGLSYRQNIPLDDLRTLVQTTLKERQEKQITQSTGTHINKLPKEVIEMQQASNALVRCTITCLDPSKQDIPSMIYTVCNDNLIARRQFPVTGIVWHVEKIIFEHLKKLQFKKYPLVNKNGKMVADVERGVDVPLFQIQELPMLTTEELTDLAEQQRKNGTGQQEK